MKEKFIEFVSKYGEIVWGYASIRILITLVVTYFATKYLPYFVGRYLNRYPQVKRIVQKTGVTLIWMTGLLVTLAHLGVDVSSIIASLGLLGFALGLALKDTVTNLISGVMIMLYAPFERNDIIEFGGHTGKVQWIDMKYTTLCEIAGMDDDDIILIPNQSLFQKTIIVKQKANAVEAKILQQEIEDEATEV